MKILPKSSKKKKGFLLMEAVLALLLFSVMAVSYTRTLRGIRQNSIAVQANMQVAQILSSALTETLTLPTLEEGETITENEEIAPGGQILTVVEPMEIENEEGRILPQMFRVRVSALWRQDGQDMEETVEGWRYLRLYRP